MMAHKVTFLVPERPLANVDVEFNVRKNETMLGVYVTHIAQLPFSTALLTDSSSATYAFSTY